MIWYFTGLVWVVHLLLWGVGLTLLVLPTRWRRFWPAFCGLVGIGLQTAVVWVGAHTTLPGTDRYAALSFAIPVVMLAAAILRCGGVKRTALLLAGVRRWSAVIAIMVLSLVVQAYPFTKPPVRLTSASVGSCDAADYAAGARVFKEFSRGDRSGFLGMSPVNKQLSVDNFFDFWLRLNHFSPSALIALNASVFHRQPYELTSLLGIVLLTLDIPMVFWLARSGFRLGQQASAVICAIYGFSPILFYAVFQTALAQLIAAPAVALVTWAGLQSYRQGSIPWGGARYFGLILIGNWLLLGGYNFFILFAYIPLFAYVGLQTLRTRAWAGSFRWLALIATNLVISAALFFERTVSLAERFKLFNQTPFGWPIPGLTPIGWYGAVADALLSPTVDWGAVCLVGLCLHVLLRALEQYFRSKRWHALTLVAAYSVPAFLGYFLLLRQDSQLHNNASYDAYKLFAVFYPGVLCSLCLWMGGSNPATSRKMSIFATILGYGILILNVNGALRFNGVLRKSTLIVDDALAGLSVVEKNAGVTSVNVRLPIYWNRLWANYFLLHKAQYFSESTYEGRAVTALRGDWDLCDRILPVKSDRLFDPLAGNASYYLIDRRSPDFLEARLDNGWYEIEHFRNRTWCWSNSLAPAILIINSHAAPFEAVLSLSARSVEKRHLKVFSSDQCVWEGETNTKVSVIAGLRIRLTPGDNHLRFETPEPASVDPDGGRKLTIELDSLQIDLPRTNSPEVDDQRIPASVENGKSLLH